MGSGGVAIAALPTVICLKVPFSDGLGGVGSFGFSLHLIIPEVGALRDGGGSILIFFKPKAFF